MGLVRAEEKKKKRDRGKRDPTRACSAYYYNEAGGISWGVKEKKKNIDDEEKIGRRLQRLDSLCEKNELLESRGRVRVFFARCCQKWAGIESREQLAGCSFGLAMLGPKCVETDWQSSSGWGTNRSALQEIHR